MRVRASLAILGLALAVGTTPPAVAGQSVSAQSVSAQAAKIDINDPNAKRIACYRKDLVPAQYQVTKHLEKPAQRAYVKRRSGVIELMEFPAVYREEKKLIKAAHYVMRQIECK